MKKIAAVFAICLISIGASQAQIVIPGLFDTTGLAEELMGLDSPSVKQMIPEEDTPIIQKDTTLEADEIQVRKLEIQAQKLKLEKEIKALTNKDNLTKEEKELLKINTENLRIVALKERMLLEQEYDEMRKDRKQKNYPPAAVYGQQFFRDGTFKYYEKTNEIVATEGYVLGSGDVVQLEVWGYRYWSKSYVISETGSIDISGYQKVFVKGLTLRQAREMIGSRLGLGGAESSFAISVTRPRLVSVNILGEVFQPGTYTLPATNSAFNALVSMGGPSDIGSVRNIYIKRDGKVRDSFDVYEYFNNVQHQRDVYLQNNDYIIVMPASNVVQVNGHIKRPGTYELKAGEGILDLMQFAGGAFPNTYLRDVVITRIQNSVYEVLSVNVDSLRRIKKDFPLTGVQTVDFKSISSDNQFAVLINGAVSVPGTYRVKKGIRLSGLIKNANGLTTDAFMDKGYLVRTNKDNSKNYITFSPAEIISLKGAEKDILIEDRDSVYIFKRAEIQKFNNIQISGEVYKPMTINYISGLKLGELLFMAGGLTEAADASKGFIIRTNADFEKQLIAFEPAKVISRTADFDLELLPKDEVIIYSKSQFLRKYKLEIQGAVKNPQVFEFSENTRVADLVALAGGLEASAYGKRALIMHEDLTTGIKSSKTVNLEQANSEPSSSANMLLEKNDVLVIFDLTELKTDFAVAIFGEVRKSGEYPYADNMSLQNLVDLAGGVEFISAGTEVEIVRNLFVENGTYLFMKPQVIVSHISDNLLLDSGLSDFKLQPFDKVFIRKNPNFIASKLVYIDGAVMYPGYYALKGENEKLSSIFQRAGGFRPDAMVSGVNVTRVRKGGDTISVVVQSKKAMRRKRSHYNMIVKGGDVITVPFSESLVTISGDLNNNRTDLGAYYKKGKRAKYYVRNFGGGFTRTSDKRNLVVVKANGARVGTHNYVLFRVYPKVTEGSKIEVPSKPVSNKPSHRADLDTVLGKFLTRATAALSLIGLYKVATAP